MLNKKDNKNCDSPEVEHPQLPTPGTIARYEHINREFDAMMNQVGGVRPQVRSFSAVLTFGQGSVEWLIP